MLVNSSTRFAAIAALVGALACAGNTAREADTDETAAARDTTMADTLGGQDQNQPGYRGMETDTTGTPDQQPIDTFLQNQGTGQQQDTSGYSGMERVDTTQQGNQQGQVDTTSMQGQTDTTTMQGQTDTTSMQGQTDTTGAYQSDTSATGQEQPTGDTTGYDNQQTDTTTSR